MASYPDAPAPRPMPSCSISIIPTSIGSIPAMQNFTRPQDYRSCAKPPCTPTAFLPCGQTENRTRTFNTFWPKSSVTRRVAASNSPIPSPAPTQPAPSIWLAPQFLEPTSPCVKAFYFAHRLHNVDSGCASRRLTSISLSQFAQNPYSPASILQRASCNRRSRNCLRRWASLSIWCRISESWRESRPSVPSSCPGGALCASASVISCSSAATCSRAVTSNSISCSIVICLSSCSPQISPDHSGGKNIVSSLDSSLEIQKFPCAVACLLVCLRLPRQRLPQEYLPVPPPFSPQL